jgi:SAM-dependent methyltransferase
MKYFRASFWMNRYMSWLQRLSKKRSRQGLYKFLAEQFSRVPGNSTVLTVGSGGEVNKLLDRYAKATGFKVTSLDIDPKRLPDVIGDACNCPFADNAFDAVVVSEVLEHLHTPPDALASIHRILKTDGLLILTTPFILPMHDRPYDYFRFTEHGVKLLLARFKDTSIKPRNSYFETIDVLWVRLLQTDLRSARLLSLIIIPIVYFLSRPLTLLLGKLVATDAMTTGYVVSARK